MRNNSTMGRYLCKAKFDAHSNVLKMFMELLTGIMLASVDVAMVMQLYNCTLLLCLLPLRCITTRIWPLAVYLQ